MYIDGNYTRMRRAILNKSWRQHPTKHQLYGHLPPITKTIKVRRTRHAGHCWRRRDELISDVLLWTPKYGRANARWPARTYIQQLCEDTGCSYEDLPEAMNDREKWRERESQGYPCWRHDMMLRIYIYICIYIIIIIIIKLCWWRWVPWLFHHQALSSFAPDYIWCPRRPDVHKTLVDIQNWREYVQESIREHW